MSALSFPFVFQPNTPEISAQMNAQFTAMVTWSTQIDNSNVGSLGFYANQIKPVAASQASFGGSLAFTMPAGLGIAGALSGITTASAASGASGGYLFTTAAGHGVYGGTGAPAFNAPNGSIFLRYDSAVTPLYINTSGASSSGTTWTGLNIAQLAPYAYQAVPVSLAYTGTGSETNAAPGSLASITLALPSSSPGTNNRWRVNLKLYVTQNTTNTAPVATTALGIFASSAGSVPFRMFGGTGTATHLLTSPNCVSDVSVGNTAVGRGAMFTVPFSADYPNGATPTFTGLLGASNLNDVYQCYIEAIAFPD